MTDKNAGVNKGKELVKNTTIVTIGKLCTKAISFLLLPLYTAVLTQEEYGIAELITSYVMLLATVFFLHIEDALFRYLVDVREEKDKESTVISSAFAFALLQCVVLTLLYFVLQIWIDIPYKIYLLLTIITATFSGMMLQISRGLGDNMGYSIASFITALVTIAANIITVLLLDMGAGGLLLSSCVGYMAGGIYLLFRKSAYRFFRPGAVSVKKLREMLQYSLPLVPNALSWWIVGASDKTIVTFFLGVAGNGVLAVAQKFSNLFTTIYGIFNLTWTENASIYKDAPDRETYFSGIIESSFRLLVGACLGIIAVMPFVYDFLVNEQYGEAYGLVPPYMLSALFFSLIGIYSVVYVAYKDTKEVAKTSALAAVINVVANLALIRFIGLYAAPISSVIAYASMFIYRVYDTRRYIRIHVKSSVPISALLIAIPCFFTYYTAFRWAQVLNLLVVAVYVLYLNRQLLSAIVKQVRTRFFTKGEGKGKG